MVTAVPIPAEMIMEVKLQAQQWNVVLAGLGELQQKIAGPLVAEIMTQIQSQVPREAAAIYANGSDAEASPPQGTA